MFPHQHPKPPTHTVSSGVIHHGARTCSGLWLPVILNPGCPLESHRVMGWEEYRVKVPPQTNRKKTSAGRAQASVYSRIIPGILMQSQDEETKLNFPRVLTGNYPLLGEDLEWDLLGLYAVIHHTSAFQWTCSAFHFHFFKLRKISILHRVHIYLCIWKKNTKILRVFILGPG